MTRRRFSGAAAAAVLVLAAVRGGVAAQEPSPAPDVVLVQLAARLEEFRR